MSRRVFHYCSPSDACVVVGVALQAPMILNLHEEWLLLRVRLRGQERRATLRALKADGQHGGKVDVAAQLAGIQLAQATIRRDLAVWFDWLLSPLSQPAAHVVYGHRSYKREVILAAAMAQAGVSASQYTAGRAAGFTRLAQFAVA